MLLGSSCRTELSWRGAQLEKPNPEPLPEPCRAGVSVTLLCWPWGQALPPAPRARAEPDASPAARVSSRCKCYEFFTKQASLIV